MICCFNCGANEMVEIEWIKMLRNEESFREYSKIRVQLGMVQGALIN